MKDENLESKEAEKSKIVNLTKEFLKNIKSLSQIQKINLIYSNLTGKKPDPLLDTNKKINRILFEQKFGNQIKNTKEFMKKKKFSLPKKWKNVLKTGSGKGRQVVVFYLTAKGTIEPPKIYPVYSSNMIIINNSPYEVPPAAFWRLGKYQVLLIKEIDRRAVSNLDYEEIRKRGDQTDSDEYIIRAAMLAGQNVQKKKPVNKAVIIIFGIIILAAIVFLVAK